jgi:hypothetical protein
MNKIYLPASRFLCQQLPFPTSVNSLPNPPVWHQHSAPVPASVDQVLVLMEPCWRAMLSHAPPFLPSLLASSWQGIPGIRIIQATVLFKEKMQFVGPVCPLKVFLQIIEGL